MEMDFLKQFPWQIWLPIAFLLWLIPLSINVLFAIGVANDAEELHSEGEETYFVGPIVWAFAALFGGVFVAAVYWVIHRSALRRGSSYVKDSQKRSSGLLGLDEA